MMQTVLVMGGAHIDRRGRIDGSTAMGASNPGRWFTEPGGGGFNAARNLARLGHPVRLIAPRGGDEAGESIAAAAEDAGIDDRPFTFLDRATPSYTAILERDGNLVIALADMELYRYFTPRRLKARSVRDAMEGAGLLLCDANLPEDTLRAIGQAAADKAIPLAAIAISPAKVMRFQPMLGLVDYLFMNAAEAAALTGAQPPSPNMWPEILRDSGLKGGMVTNGSGPAVAFDAEGAALLAPAALDSIADVTGAGDAAVSGFLTARLGGAGLGEALRHAAAAAAITLQSPNATAGDMSPGLLKSRLGLVPEAAILS